MRSALAPAGAGTRTPTWTNAVIPALPVTYVHPGQIAVSSSPGALATILGSCVAVCLYDPRLRLGGLNHYLLPNHGAAPDFAGRYGPVAIAQLVNEMCLQGASIKRLQAHIVGGAAVLAAFTGERQHLGLRNAQLAREMMAEYGIPVVSSDVGGNRGRKLLFAPREGTISIQVIGA